MLLKDKVALITGGAKGMGEATSLKFAEEGAKVIIADLNIDAAKETAEKINEHKGTARAYAQVDVTDKASIKNTVDKTLEEFGKVDVLINFAGGTFGADGTTENINMDDWDKTIDLNLNGTIYPILEVLPHMKKAEYGKIINFSSMGAFSPYTVVLHYHAAKGAVESLTRNLAFELAAQGITVNAIAPGPIMTPFWDELMEPGEERDAFVDALAKKEVPMQRMGTPEDIAGVCLFLGSELSSFVTGEIIKAGGGLGNVVSQESTFLSSSDNDSVNK